MNDMLMPLRRYADFSGRSRRREYWLFTLFVFTVEALLYAWIVAAAIAADGTLTPMVLVPFVLVMNFVLLIFIPWIAVTVRRLHDLDRSGWHYFLMFVPLIGPILLLVWMCTEGTKGPNRYGPDPKAEAGA